MSDFGIKEVGTMDISWEDLGWKNDRGSPLGSGSFASFYRGTLKLDVAPKLWEKPLNRGSVINFFSETDTLRLVYSVLQLLLFLYPLLLLAKATAELILIQLRRLENVRRGR